VKVAKYICNIFGTALD